MHIITSSVVSVPEGKGTFCMPFNTYSAAGFLSLSCLP